MQDINSQFRQALAAAKIAAPLQTLLALVPEASTRRYYRLQLQDQSTIIGVLEDSKTATHNFATFAATRNFLNKNQVRVPEIYFSDPRAGVMLQQDLGDTSLNAALQVDFDKSQVLYQAAIAHMLRWQSTRPETSLPAFTLAFDKEKLMFEFDFFLTHTLAGYYAVTLPNADLSLLRSAFVVIAAALAAPTNKVFTHRDYHSRNIMMLHSDGINSADYSHDQQYIIDFQDARLGLTQYDLSSLLCDAYAPLAEEQRRQLIQFAYTEGKSIHQQTQAEFEYYFALSAFQRLIKAMGTFGYQAALGRADFAAYLVPAWQMAQEMAQADNQLTQTVKLLMSALASSANFHGSAM